MSSTNSTRALRRGSESRCPVCSPRPSPTTSCPCARSFLGNGFSSEEMKLLQETRKILSACLELEVSMTCVRVPVHDRPLGHAC